MEKLKMETLDLTDKNVDKIAKLFPNVITETRDKDGNVKKTVDFDLLRQILSKDLVEDDDERYRLDWPGKKASILKANRSVTKTLRPCREESLNFDTTQNLYLEGDNFEILKILQESYLGKIKMIYIDPPYNTGNDFIYKDDFKQTRKDYEEELGIEDDEGGKLFKNTDTNGRFHSDWLSMMYERLIIARDLLKDDGVIFISIDDGEVHNLKKICDEIFGETNFVTEIILEITKTQGMKVSAAKKGSIVKNCEYVLCYCKNNNDHKIVKNILYDKNIGYDIHFSYYIQLIKNEYRIFKLIDILKNEKIIFNEFKKFDLLKNGNIPIKSIEKALNLSKIIKKFLYTDIADKIFQEMACDITIPQEIKAQLDNKKIVKYKDYLLTKSTGGKLRQFGALSKTLNYSDEYNSTYGRVTIRGNLWKGFYSDMMNVAKEGDMEYKNGKKPIRLIMQLCKWIGLSNEDYIFDFFSGSATTAHAVMQLNAEDGGNRKFIMAQLPEKTDEKSEAYKAGYKTIADIGKERIRRAGKKIIADLTEKNGEKPEKLDIGFRVYKTDTTNMKDVFYHPDEYEQSMFPEMESNIKEDRTPEDLLTQVMLDLGLTLDLPMEKKEIKENKVFIVQTNALIACFDKNINFEIVDEIAKLGPFKVVFQDACFKDDKDRINVSERFKRLSPDTRITVI